MDSEYTIRPMRVEDWESLEKMEQEIFKDDTTRREQFITTPFFYNQIRLKYPALVMPAPGSLSSTKIWERPPKSATTPAAAPGTPNTGGDNN